MTPTLNRVLAATDFSSLARRAAERAALIARQTGATLDLVHVLDLTPLERLRRIVANAPPSLQQQLFNHAQSEVMKLAESLHSRYGVDAGPQVVSAPLLSGLTEHAASVQAELIVLGARGESFMRHLMLGSTAARMLSIARLPLLVVKQVAHEPYRRLLVAVDFSAASVPALQIARGVAPGAEMLVLNAYDVAFEGQLRFASVDDALIQSYRSGARDEALQKMNALLDQAGLARGSVRTLLVHGNASSSIVEQEQIQDCDLIVIGKRGESMLSEFLLGSVTRHVLAEAQGDVLVSM